MIDLKLFRENSERVIKSLSKRNFDLTILEKLQKVDRQVLELTGQVNELNRIRSDLSSKFSQVDASGKLSLKTQLDANKNASNELGTKLTSLESLRTEILLQIPNIIDDSVPVGKDESENKVISTWGEIPKGTFKPHWEIMDEMASNDKGVKLSGSRHIVYSGQGATMVRKLINLCLELAKKNGYVEYIVPEIVNDETLVGTGQLPKFEIDLFKLTNGQFLSPTGEVQLTNLVANQILDISSLPLNMTTFTNCYRAEAGTAGRDTRGAIRLHQFRKIELVKIVKPEDSVAEHEKLTSHAEEVLRTLNLPYRKILLCSGDTGFGSTKTYDLEVWMPGLNCYREISSCSNFGDFQARRANIKFKRTKDSKAEYCHTINGSGIAIDRLFAACIENGIKV